ncbi:MAG: heavy metal-associated domain-containing protein [Bacteroidota bacterium]|nr:heavy metal-associated domain-containing protein [Bacteroidota bacterium]
MKINYQIQGMSCGGCVNKVMGALLEIPEVEDADVQLNLQSVLLTMPDPVAVEVLQAQLGKVGNYSKTKLFQSHNGQREKKEPNKTMHLSKKELKNINVDMGIAPLVYIY